jgi:capsular polysaccharide biosynthesis protein
MPVWTNGWAKPILLFFLVVFAVTGLSCLETSMVANRVYRGRATVTLLLSTKTTPRDADIALNDLTEIVASERTLESASRSLQLYNHSMYPEEALRTIKVERIPGSKSLQIEDFSSDPEEAKATANAVASAAQQNYFKLMNESGTKQGDRSASNLKIVEGSRAYPLPRFMLGYTALLGLEFAAKILIIVLGVGLGRSARRPEGRLAKKLILCSVAVLTISVSLVISIWQMPPIYRGRVSLIELPAETLSSKTAVEDSMASLRDLTMSNKVVGAASKTLLLYHLVRRPDELLRTLNAEPIPDSHILKIEVASGDSDAAEAMADVVASELQTAYRSAHGVPDNVKADKMTPRLLVLESAHVYPDDRNSHRVEWLGYAIAACISLLLFAGLGSIFEKRRARRAAQQNAPSL